MPGRKVRVSRPLPPDCVASTMNTTFSRATATTTTTAAMTKKPKRIPRGPAAKRSRALRTTLDGVSGGGRRGPVSNDVTSRFPMPYPGVGRGRPARDVPAAKRTPHQRAKLKSQSDEHVVRAGHHSDREPLGMPVGSSGVARKRRKRPRSAVLAPSRAEFGRPAAPPPTVTGLLNAKRERGGQFSSSRMKRTANNNAELPGATSLPHGGRIVGGGKKTRCVVCRESHGHAPPINTLYYTPCSLPSTACCMLRRPFRRRLPSVAITERTTFTCYYCST